MVGAVHLEMIDKIDMAFLLLAIQRFLAVRPRPTVFLADNGTNFHGRENVLGEAKMTKKNLKDKRPIDLSEAQRKLNIEFRFAPPRAPNFQGLVERVVGSAKVSLRPALSTALVSSEELRKIFAKTLGIINNFPIAYTIRSNMDFHYRPLTPNYFLMGQPYTELQAEDTTKMTAVKRYKKVQKILRIFWAKLIAELMPHQRQYNNWIAETRGVKEGNIALLLDPKKRGMLLLVRITEVQRGINTKIWRVTVFDGFTHFGRAITSLAVLVPADAEDYVNNERDCCRRVTRTATRSQLDAKLSGNQ
jgi:hypothetical protein